ncbi:L-2-amino-thiazoline-4-carboxylic acid hydrolase [Actinomadura gamaensis]|uniref:L-2-amino-thiazoline-4-carboxylic acid hydrolase n=1 Tax=Actinomadura gamaensis TaxID=1763541 RepID=A0ABV9TTJ9_9ACTN
MREITDPNLRRGLAEQLRRYRELRERLGPERAREAMLDGLPEKQAARLGPAVAAGALAEGMAKALPWLEAAGLVHEVVDERLPGEDAALEIAFTCTCVTAAEELGLSADQTEPLLCDLEVEATRRALPELDVRALAHRAEGARVCVFRYRRTASPSGDPGSDR